MRALAAAVACAAALVAVLLAAYAIGPVERLDADALTGFGNLRNPERVPVAEFVAHLADPLPLLVLLVGVCGAGIALGRTREAAAAVFVVLAANVTTQALKVFLAHPRLQPLGGGVGPVAFPSGHATAATSIAVAAILVAPRRARAAVAACGAAFALAVGLSIILLDWHFPSDVAGGMLIATGFGCLALAMLAAAGSRRPPPVAPAGGLEPGPGGRPELEALAIGAGIAILVAVLASAGELLDYARANTAAAAAAVSLTLVCAVLMVLLTALAGSTERAIGSNA
jgi:membrane-associated phospholipid phosphatase